MLSLILEVFVRYARYVIRAEVSARSCSSRMSAWPLSFTYPWGRVAYNLVGSRISRWTPGYITVIVAVLGTTISPYLFFWQAEEEVEEVKEREGGQTAGAGRRRCAGGV